MSRIICYMTLAVSTRKMLHASALHVMPYAVCIWLRLYYSDCQDRPPGQVATGAHVLNIVTSSVMHVL